MFRIIAQVKAWLVQFDSLDQFRLIILILALTTAGLLFNVTYNIFIETFGHIKQHFVSKDGLTILGIIVVTFWFLSFFIVMLFAWWRIYISLRQELGPGEAFRSLLNSTVVIGIGIILALMQVYHSKQLSVLQANHRAQLAFTQAEQSKQIADQQNSKISVDYFSSPSPAVRLKGVQELYKRAGEGKNPEEVLELFKNQIKYFTVSEDYKKAFPKSPSIDIQELLNIISMRVDKYSTQNNIFANLLESTKHEVKLPGAYLVGANLEGAQLQGAHLRDVQLQSADLRSAQLQGAYLLNAQLQDAHLWYAQLQDAYLGDAQLQGANLQYAQLQAADLGNAQLQGAYLRGAQLQAADLGNAQLQGAYLRDAQLQGTHLQYAQLQSANLRNAQLQSAYLLNAQLQGAYLLNAQLQGAYLRGAQLQGTYSGLRFSIPANFEIRINLRAGKEAELDTVTLKGGLTRTDLEKIEDGMNFGGKYWRSDQKEWLSEVLKELRSHINMSRITGSSETQVVLDTLLEMGASDTVFEGTYSKEEAEQWIQEFKDTLK